MWPFTNTYKSCAPLISSSYEAEESEEDIRKLITDVLSPCLGVWTEVSVQEQKHKDVSVMLSLLTRLSLLLYRYACHDPNAVHMVNKSV